MTKGRRKLASARLRKEWLRRFEDGESVPRIADSDGWDVRTIRKQLELSRQEREVAEARSGVLRQALERHYVDLCTLAEKIDAAVAKEFQHLFFNEREARIRQALQEHLPKSAIWKLLDEWEGLLGQLEACVAQLRETIVVRAEDRLCLRLNGPEGEIEATKGFIDSLVFHFRAGARGWKGLEEVQYVTSPSEKGQSRVQHGAFAWVVPEEMATSAQKVHRDLKLHGLGWEEYQKLQACSEKLLQVRSDLRDQLAVLILRRVVPGRCVYCPA